MIEAKIIKDIDTFSKLLAAYRSGNKKIVFTNGCFDILHPGHCHYLQEAKRLGDLLVVGINSDASVQRLKGKSRPINHIDFRTQMLAALESVDKVIVFEEDTPLQLIKKIEPHILVKGADYSPESVVGADFVIEKGGEVKLIPLLEGFSSTKSIEKIRNLDK